MGDNGKPLKPGKSMLPISKKVIDPDNTNSDDEVLEAYDETGTFMASTSSNFDKVFKSGSGGRHKSLYEKWKEDYYEDSYDDE